MKPTFGMKVAYLLHLFNGEFSFATAPDIGGSWNSFQMVRVDARAVTTEVVDLKPLGYLSVLLYVEQSMGEPVTPIIPEVPVAIALAGTHPIPAAGGWIDNVQSGIVQVH